MAELTIEPSYKSFLSNNKFSFAIKRLPNLTFFVQNVNLPNMSLGTTTTLTPFAPVQSPGNIITFSPFTVNFIVDEEMESWYEIYNWMVQLGNPQGYDKLGNLTKTPGRTNSVTSDATLYIKTNANNPNFKIDFVDIFPVELGDLNFSTTEGQDFVITSATFNYTYYTASPYSA